MFRFYSIIIFCLDLGSEFLETFNYQVPVFTLNCSVIAGAHYVHYMLLPAPLQSWLVVDAVAERSLVQLGHVPSLLFRESVEALGGVLPEEVIPVEDEVEVEEGGSHPDGSHSSQPPGVGFHNEVGIVKHLI